MDQEKDEMPRERSAWQRPRLRSVPAREAEASLSSYYSEHTTLS